MPPRAVIAIRNRQRLRRVNSPLLKQITKTTLHDLLDITGYELAIHLVGAPEMARINWRFLQHEGSTDVITFDLSTPPRPRTPDPGPRLTGEIFICLADAIAQAREFKTSWQSEIIRYVVHGVLHLLGHDDLQPAARRKMKREENRLLRRLAKQFPLPHLALPLVKK